MKKIALSLILLSSCSGVGAHQTMRRGLMVSHVSVSNDQCVNWLSARRTWNALSIAGGTLAAGSGAFAAARVGDEWVQTGSGIAVVVLGALAAVGAAMDRSVATDFDRYCNTDPAPPTPPTAP